MMFLLVIASIALGVGCSYFVYKVFIEEPKKQKWERNHNFVGTFDAKKPQHTPQPKPISQPTPASQPVQQKSEPVTESEYLQACETLFKRIVKTNTENGTYNVFKGRDKEFIEQFMLDLSQRVENCIFGLITEEAIRYRTQNQFEIDLDDDNLSLVDAINRAIPFRELLPNITEKVFRQICG